MLHLVGVTVIYFRQHVLAGYLVRNITIGSRDRSVGEQMYLTVCPLCGPGHGSLVG